MKRFRVCSDKIGWQLIREGYHFGYVNAPDRETVLAVIDQFSSDVIYWRTQQEERKAKSKEHFDVYDYTAHFYEGRSESSMDAAVDLAIRWGLASSICNSKEKLSYFRAQQAKLLAGEAQSQLQSVAAEQVTIEPDQGGQNCDPGESPGPATNFAEVAA